MTVEEYLKNNLPFFHITPLRNKEIILMEGIKRRGKDICVVRTDDLEILYTIIEAGLINFGEEYCVFRIEPLKHDIKVYEVYRDRVTDATHPLHNYFTRGHFPMTEEDFCFDFRLPEKRELYTITSKVNSRRDFERLENYAPRPDDDYYDDDNNFKDEAFFNL